MRIVVVTLALQAGLALALQAGLSVASHAQELKQPVQSPPELQPYDSGFAFQAGQECTGWVLLVAPDEAMKGMADFKRGTEMFAHYKSLQNLDGACKAALNLYNSKTGKVAKLLDQPAKP